MTNVLFVARYRNPSMTRKLDLLAQEPDFRIRHICPAVWEDELVRVEQRACPSGAYEQQSVGMLGRPSDPHRALYNTLDFGLRGFRADLIHAEEEPDSLSAVQIALARRLWAPRARLLFYSWQNVNRPKRPWVRTVMRASFRAADAVMCASEEAIEVLWANGFAKSAALVTAIGVDTQVFRPCGDARPADRPFTVGYVGRLVPEKGVETLLAAAGRIGPPVSVLILGNGPQRGELERLIGRGGLSDRVQLLPPEPQAGVAKRMCEMDVLVLPSRTTGVWKEQFGRVLIEAMACRVPVVGSDSGAIPEVIGDAGLTFPEGDADALAERLGRLRASAALRSELGERGRLRVEERYTQERVAKETIDLWREVLGGQSAP